MATNNIVNSVLISSTLEVTGGVTFSGTSDFIISTTGNVGIGTSSPGAKLDITTDHTSQIPIRVTHNNYNDWLIQKRRSDDTQKLGIKEVNSNGGMGFATADTVRMVIDSSGNVGIGTTSPAYKLDVNGDIYISNGESLYLGNANSRISSNSSSDILYFPNRDHVFGSVVSGADVERMRITEAGNVGIGTASPAEKLDINGNAIVRGRIYFDGTTSSYIDNISNGITVRSDNEFKVDTYSGGWQNRMTITDAGNVGIGTTSPAGRLELNGSGQSWSTAPAIRMWDSFNSKGWLVGNVNNITAGDFYIRTLPGEDTNPGASNNEFTIKHATGNVGIGTTNPLEELEVKSASFTTVSVNTDRNTAGENIGSFAFYGYNSATTPENMWYTRIMSSMTDVTDGSENGDIFFQQLNDGTGLETFRVKSSGEIQFPQYGAGYLKTDANGVVSVDTSTIEDTLQSVTDRGATTSNTIEFTGAANAYVGIQGETDVNLKIGTGAGSEPRMYLFGSANGQSNAGNVFIGTANNTGMVDINGDVDISGFAGFNGITAPDFPVDISSVDGGKVLRSTRGTSIFRIDQSNDGPGYIGMQSADDLSIQTNNTSKMYITSAGNVGIGTTSPSQKLAVIGNVIAGAGAADNYFEAVHSDGSSTRLHGYGLFMGRTSSYIRPTTDNTHALYIGTDGNQWSTVNIDSSTTLFKTNGVEHMRITSGGNVGIGTTTPDAPLTVHNSTDPEIRFGYSSTQDHRIVWDSSKVYIHADPENANASSAIGLGVDGTIGLFMDNEHDVGIGTNSPNTRLHVADSTTGVIMRIQNSSAGEESSLRFQALSSTSTQEYADIALDPQAGSGALVFRNPYTSERMRIDSSGNVGIGTTSPNAKIDVNISAVGEYAYFGSGSTRQLRLSSYNTTSDHAGHKINASSLNGEIILATGGTDAITVKNDQSLQFNSYGAGYLKSDASGNITVDTSTIEDTLDSVTDRGNTTTNSISVGAITLTDDPASNNGTFVKVYEDEHKRMYVATLDFTFTAAGTYNFNLVFPNSGAFHYELTGVTGRNSNYRNFGTLKDSSYIYWETDEDFTHRAEGDVHLISNYGNGMYFSADTTAFATDGVTDSSQTGTAAWSYFVVRYSIYLPDATTGSDGRWKLHLTTYGDTGSSVPQFVLA